MHGSDHFQPTGDAHDIVARAMASTGATAPGAAVLAAPPPPARRRRSAGSMTLLLWGLLALLVLGLVAMATGMLQLGGGPGGGGAANGSGWRDGAFSYYHDRDYDSSEAGPRWNEGRDRTTDPDEAPLGDTSRWEYDGPYRYGAYGSDGMRRRASGKEATDPLYSQAAPISDVFTAYGGDLDPSGGEPVGMVPSSLTNPYFDPYAGYSNPYANRIRMAYGEGYGRGTYFDPQP